MPQAKRPKRAGDAALDRLHTSLDAAESALKDLRNELRREARGLLKSSRLKWCNAAARRWAFRSSGGVEGGGLLL